MVAYPARKARPISAPSPILSSQRKESAATQNYAILTGVVVGVVVVAALYFGKEVLLPVTVAILLSFVLSPLVSLLRRINIPRPIAVLLSVALALATITGIGALVGTQVVDLAADLPRYQLTIEKKVDAFRSATIERTLAGQVAEPMLYGRSTGLSPISVVISVIFWTWLWGSVGLILATPLTLCLVVLGQHVKQLEFLNVLFGNRPALTSVENFYQRILAGDLDELQEHAEDLLKKMSLSSYYDEIALKGLELAALDIARGVLTTAQLERIHDIIAELIDALSDYDDVEPTEKDDQHDEAEKVIPLKPGRHQANAKNTGETRVEQVLPATEQGVVCVASRGRLEEAAGMMLAQILSKHSLKVEAVKPQAVSRSQIDQLHCAGAAVICICYIDAGDSTSQLR